MRLAWFVPSPPDAAIEQFSALLLPHLTQLADVTVFPGLDAMHALEPGTFDMLIYNTANMTAAQPGVVILHGRNIHAAKSAILHSHYGLIVHSSTAKDALLPLSSSPIRVLDYPNNLDDALQYSHNLIKFVELARYNKPLFDLTDFAAGLLVELGADAVTAPTLIEVFTREIEALANSSTSLSTPSAPTIAHHGKPIITLSDSRWMETMHYYSEFPLVVKPYLVLNPKAPANYSGGPKGLYGFIRNALVRFKLQSLVERVIGPRLILTVRFFFSYPRVSDLYIVPPSSIVKMARKR